MMSALDDLYLVWLYDQVKESRYRARRHTYNRLFTILLSTEFTWNVPNDDNRIEDARELRREFMIEAEIPDVDREWMNLGCSFLELLVVLSRMLAFETDSRADNWFWVLLQNVELHDLHDKVKYDDEMVQEVCEQVIWRTYEHDGTGGLFPLKSAQRDQRKVELWYQLCAYVLEL